MGVLVARCGHQLSGGTPLYDVSQGQMCALCSLEPDDGIPDNSRNRAVIAVLDHDHSSRVDLGTYLLSTIVVSSFPELARPATLDTLSPSSV